MKSPGGTWTRSAASIRAISENRIEVPRPNGIRRRFRGPPEGAREMSGRSVVVVLRSVLALCLLLLPAAAARQGGSVPLAGAGGPEKTVLKSGIPCIFHRDGASPMTVVGLVLPGGKSAVPRGLDGLAAMTTRLALEIPDEGKVRDLMAQATRMSFVCLEDHSVILIECLSENLEEALRVAGKIVQDPLISGLRVGRAKELMRLYGRAEEDDAGTAAHNAVLSLLFSGEGYGSALYGTEASLKAIGRREVLEFYKNRFTGTSSLLHRRIGPRSGSRPGLSRKVLLCPPGSRPRRFLPHRGAGGLPAEKAVRLSRDTKQTFVGRAYALPAPEPGAYAKGVLTEVLIGRGPGSRLWRLRADGRLAYNVGAHLTWTRGAGILEVFLETENAKSTRASEALDREIGGLQAGGIAADELEASKAMAKSGLLRSVEAKSGRARLLSAFEVLGLGFDHLPRLFAEIDAVGIDDLNAYLRTVLSPERAVGITVGPDEGRIR
ncbi:MAG: insulinase family protein [Candidatus Moduliflexus flocculans]|nr:insulinase family protein [Candidatus Moduliflexus flocculans]